MFSKPVYSGEDEVPETDEGWWSAVLAEEEPYEEKQKDDAAKTVISIPLAKMEWDHIQEIFERDEIICLNVHGFNRGGLLVQGEAVQGFVPISHLVNMPSNASEENRRKILSDYVGKCIQVKVIECDPHEERVVFSERAAQAGEGKRKVLFMSLTPGCIVSGTVTNVTRFGAFVDLGGVEGLVHVSELSWGRVERPDQFLKVGETVHVQVLQVSAENSRIALSLKRLAPNPWEKLAQQFKAGDVVQATVTSMTRFGAFARLEEGIEGLIHVSSIKMPPGLTDIHELLSTGQEIQVCILHLDAERRRLGLGLVQTE
jgi:small subunit ribosomal protein S1